MGEKQSVREQGNEDCVWSDALSDPISLEFYLSVTFQICISLKIVSSQIVGQHFAAISLNILN